MNSRQSIIVQAMHGSIVLAAIICVTVLGVQGTIDGQSIVAVLGAAIGFAGGSVASLGALGQAVNGKATVPSSYLADRETTVRTAIAGAAASPSHALREGPDVPDFADES